MKALPLAVLMLSLALLAAENPKTGARWPQFRGPGGSGLAADSAPLPTEFGPGKNVQWRAQVGPGHASPAVWDDKVFIAAHGDSVLETLCLDRKTGKRLWRNQVRVEKYPRMHKINSPAASSPATDGEFVYVYFGAYGLLAYTMDGTLAWERRLPVPRIRFGSAVSPIVVRDYVVFNHDTDGDSWLEVINRKTGESIWRVEREGFGAGWSTPTIWRRNGVDELIVYGVWWLTSYDLETGEKLWAVPGLADEPAITPVMGDGHVYVSSYNMKTNPEVIGLPSFEELLAKYDKDSDGMLNREEAAENKSILSRHDADGEGDHPLRIFYRMLDKNKDDRIDGEEWKKLVAWIDSFSHENALLAIRPGAPGETPDMVWKHTFGVPEIPSPLYLDGRVYLVKNGGIVTSLDAKNGAQQYRARLGSAGPYYASPVTGDNKIFAASARGVVTVFVPGPELKVLARNDMKARIMATPAIADGSLYIRAGETLYAFGLTGR